MDYVCFAVFAVYAAWGYLALPDTLWRSDFRFLDDFYDPNWDIIERTGRHIALGIVLGWFVIPWWLIRKRKNNSNNQD